MRMPPLRRSPCLLILPLALAGCASTSGFRSGVSPKMRTVASIGDKPLNVTTGEPGQAVTAETEAPERRSRSDGRISGRVVDEQGEPVPFARVRLAMGGTPGGKIISTTTDRSGAFTLRGLRPGSSYTIITEWEDGQSLLTGRSEVEAPDADVQISLGPSDTRGADRSNRVKPVSTREAEGEDGVGERRDGGGEAEDEVPAAPRRFDVNELPPAPEADSLPPSTGRKPRVAPSLEGMSGSRSARWRRGEPVEPSEGPVAESARRPPDEGPAPGLGAEPEPREAPAFEPATQDDEGPNPLPPALEPEKTSFVPPPGETIGRPEAVARAETAAPALEVPPGALVAVPRAAAPMSFAEIPASASSKDPGPSPAADPTTPIPAARPRRRPTWRELAERESAQEEPRGTRPPSDSGPAPAPAPAGGREVYCRYDPRSRRIEDFRLPDPEGKLVRFQDLDADLVLLDFWGTWCQPCVKSVPHLVDLQKRIGDRKLKVLGIACEQGPPQKCGATVAKAVRQLGINYPVLVSGTDGQCPLQRALHIQAYPTLILVDRQGRILWQDQGTTPLTLARLDRMLTQTLQSDDRRRF
ncbi:MAG TPA: redoxin domain-containing protein [Isosphaeraceae bacterium]|nr:redoxin domain-containing protein [Isosphaeraceae bacterium]